MNNNNTCIIIINNNNSICIFYSIFLVVLGNFSDLGRILYNIFCWNNNLEKQMSNFCSSKFYHSSECEARQVHTELNLHQEIGALLPQAH